MSWQPKKWVLACRDGFRFEVCFGFIIRDIYPLSISPPSCVSKLGNTSKCYPHSSAAAPPDCQVILLPLHFPSVSSKHFPPLMGCHQSTCHGPIGPAFSVPRGRPGCLSSGEYSTFRQCLWLSLCDTLSQVRWKRESNLEPKATQAAIWSTFLTNRAMHLALLSSCPSSQKRHLHIPEKKILSWVEATLNIGSPMCFPERSSCLKGIFPSVMLMFSS